MNLNKLEYQSNLLIEKRKGVIYITKNRYGQENIKIDEIDCKRIFNDNDFTRILMLDYDLNKIVLQRFELPFNGGRY